ncbi:MAG: hypothetical protein V1740_07755 [Candidatus Woesearchaeota archaeon]
MDMFEAIPKQWGNSIGITIPREIVKKNKIAPKKKMKFLVLNSDTNVMKSVFGTMKFKKPIQKIMDEIDEGYD